MAASTSVSSTPSAVVTSSTMASAVEPAPAAVVVAVVATVSQSPEVAALGPAASSATTAGTKDDVYDHDDRDYTQNYE